MASTPTSPHYPIDETHDPKLESWVESANDPGTDFPIQNLPLCRFAPPGELGLCDHLGVRIGNSILDLSDVAYTVAIHSDTGGQAEAEIYEGENESQLFEEWSGPFGRKIRKRVQQLLSTSIDAETRKKLESHLHNVADCEFDPPATIHDYTDFYASLYHATSVGSMFRPDNPLLPNYKHIPIGYHGRASSIVASGTDVRRPVGQQAPAEDGGAPGFGPCKLLDYELEMGVVVGRGNELGEFIDIAEAEKHMLGLCLVNDWSARDLQKWEYQPLGRSWPRLCHHGEPLHRDDGGARAVSDRRLRARRRRSVAAALLTSEGNTSAGGFDITLEVFLASEQMRSKNMDPIKLSTGNFKDMYWTLAQMLTHHSSNGCNMQPGDLLASGTVSGKTRDSRGCLLELTWNGDAFANPRSSCPAPTARPSHYPPAKSASSSPTATRSSSRATASAKASDGSARRMPGDHHARAERVKRVLLFTSPRASEGNGCSSAHPPRSREGLVTS